MTVHRPLATAVALALSVASSHAVAEEPWSDSDPALPPERLSIDDFGLTGGAEYRAQITYVNPIALNTINERRIGYIDHRLRLDATIDYDQKIRIVSSVDVLSGVLWGDNGTPGGLPEPIAGTTVNTKSPNDATPCITYKGGPDGDPLAGKDYGFGLCDGKVFKVRRLYGDVVTPVGLLRIGRQPFTLGNAIQGSPGDGRFNRFGVANEGTFVDRVSFGTKPLEALKPEEERDLTLDNGFFIVAVYDHLVSDDLRLFSDDARQVGGATFFRAKDYDVGQDLELQAYFVERWSDEFDTAVSIFGGRAISRFGPVFIGLEGAANVGVTSEVSEAYNAITNDPVVPQDILQFGGRAVVRFDHPVVRAGDEREVGLSAYLELDYASGDGDPQARTNLSQMTWAPDMNVGLLMFEHVFRFQTARAAAAATEVLRRLGAKSFPVDSIDTKGSFTNAVAIFPQFDFRPHADVLFRLGALFAWAPEPVVDPIQSLLGRDGVDIRDDLVNFAGGPPGKFYGAEVDLRGQWRFLEHFALDIEAAMLFPGDALEDENGDAARSLLVQGRTSFFF